MLLMFFALLILTMWSCRFQWHGLRSDYLSREQTMAVNGIFIVWVFIRHVQTPYLVDAGYSYGFVGDQLFRRIDLMAGQLIVAMFLFNSGYGVMSSALNGGMNYVRQMPIKRILVTYLNFVVAVAIFLFLSFIIRRPLSFGQAILSFVALDGVGNSYWYIFAILICYAIFWMSASCLNVKNTRMVCLLVSVGVLSYIFVLSFLMPLYWYSTVSAFALGCIWRVAKERIDKIANRMYWPCLCTAAMAFYIVYCRIGAEWHGIRANVATLLFVVVFVLLAMKFRFRNAALLWLGAHLFPIYMYQRLPMIILSEVSSGWLTRECVPLFIMVSLACTLIIAWAYRWWRVEFVEERGER